MNPTSAASPAAIPLGPELRPACAALTAEQVRLVQDSWPLLLPIQQPAAALFYGRLFELDPALRPMFRSEMTQQGQKLMAALNIVVLRLSRLDELLPLVQQLARRHVGYGVMPQHYDTVGAALLWTIEQGLGEAASAAVLDAWAAAYGCLADAMKAAAWPHSSLDAEWQAQAA